jgi:hypothetical protein
MKDKRKDPEQRKWDDAGPDKATGRTGAAGGSRYNEGPKAPPGSMETLTGDVRRKEDAGDEKDESFGHTTSKKGNTEWKGGTSDQGPTTGGMGAAGGGHDTADETDVWGEKK